VPDYDPNKTATRQEMRSYVCGQCHVEYYFKGPEKRLVYPWANGIKVEQIQAYYDELEYKDWTHKTSGAPALKAQHPEFEMWSQGFTPAPASPAPIATCLTSASAPRKSRIITCAVPC